MRSTSQTPTHVLAMHLVFARQEDINTSIHLLIGTSTDTYGHRSRHTPRSSLGCKEVPLLRFLLLLLPDEAATETEAVTGRLPDDMLALKPLEFKWLSL